jgi:predicted nuclease of restriction endonuclease-like (RecB) superfamily
MSKITANKDYKAFLAEIKEKVYQSQYEAMKQVNKALIKLYWEIGRSIVEKQQKHKWGKSVVENLSNDLQKEFAGVNGLSADNLWRMRKFYLNYEAQVKLAPLVQQIGWSHNVVIMEKTRDLLAREFYIKMVIKYGWTKNVLIHHMEGKSYEKFLLGQTNFDKALPEKYKHQAKLAVKDEYNFDFLEIGDEHSERELELALMRNIRKFLMEMGGDFAFIANQYRLALEEDFCIDVLLYHRRLKSLVAIDFKKGKFTPEHAGKMNFYLSVLNDKVKTEDENSSIGIIICKEKNRTTVEYALRELNQPIGITTYKVTSTLPKDYKKYLPSPETIINSLEDMFNDLSTEE